MINLSGLSSLSEKDTQYNIPLFENSEAIFMLIIYCSLLYQKELKSILNEPRLLHYLNISIEF